MGESSFNASCENGAACLLMDVAVAADMVCVAMSVDDAFYSPAILIRNSQHLFPGFLVVAAVNEIYVGVGLPVNTDFCRTIYIVALSTYLFKFIYCWLYFINEVV